MQDDTKRQSTPGTEETIPGKSPLLFSLLFFVLPIVVLIVIELIRRNGI